MNPLKLITRRAIALKRSLHNLVRRKLAQLKRRQKGLAIIPYGAFNYKKGYYKRPSLQDQHREACLSAYEAKRDLARLKVGHNSVAGIPAKPLTPHHF